MFKAPITHRSAPITSANTSDWHGMPVDACFTTLSTQATGLSESEAQIRLTTSGPNRLPETRTRSIWMRIFEQFNNVLIYVLIAAACIAFLLDHLTDALVILSVVIINAAIGLIQEGKAEKALDSIKHMVDPSASVIRDGHRISVDAETLVPGDIVSIEAGDRVPADLRLIRCSNLTIDDALLTGESMVVSKDPAAVEPSAPLGDRRSMAFWGTFVASGQGLGIVVNTGASTELGKISSLMNTIETLKTPLILQMDQFARQLTFVILLLSALAFAFAWGVQGFAISDAFMAVVGLAVAAIPEGLPAVMTITLAIGVQRMATQQAIIRRLPAVETLGSVTVICSDKTGTLTSNEMMVQHLFTRDRSYEVDGSGYSPEGHFYVNGNQIEARAHSDLITLLKSCVLNNDAELRASQTQWVIEGNPMEAALLSAAMKADIDPAHQRQIEPRIDDIPFDSKYKFMATRHAIDNEVVTLIKGAPERVLAMCDFEHTRHGDQPIDRAHWEDAMERLANRGNRVLAVAVKQGPAADRGLQMDHVLHGNTLLGLIGLMDPPRPEAKAAIAKCHTAGIRVVMITGDHALTAGEIARQLGIADTPVVCAGDEVENADKAELADLAARVDVFARTTPEHKLRIVTALQSNNQITAMTGDGVNDAPALKRADVGIAMGQKGTEAAKEASEMVLANDNFATITAAVREGRTVYDNLSKVIAWTLPTNGGQAMTILAALLFGMTLPITPVQILWVNMISAVALGLTLAFEPPEHNVMQRPPLRPHSPVLTVRLVWQIIFVSGLFVLGTFGIFQWAIGQGASVETSRTLVVNTLVVMEIFYLFSIRYRHGTSLTWTGVLGTPAVLSGVAAVVIAQAVFTFWGPMQTIFASTAIQIAQVWVMIGIGICTLIIVEIEKWFWHHFSQRRSGT
jgi:calcium-translocating P-type ATPase